MDIKDRLAAMLATAEIPAFEAEEPPHTFGVCADGRTRRAEFRLTRGGERFAAVSVEVHGADATGLAGVLWALVRGSEGRLADAKEKIERLRGALDRRKLEIAELQRKLADFEVGRHVRGEMYAIATAQGRVWLCGKPSSSAFGLCFSGWGELARERPGLRPCGTVTAEGETYIVLRPVADLATPEVSK